MKNLGLEAVNLNTVAKLGVAPLRPSCQQMRNISPRRSPNPLRFLIFDSETADAMNVGPCHHGMARLRVADGGKASNMEGSCE